MFRTTRLLFKPKYTYPIQPCRLVSNNSNNPKSYFTQETFTNMMNEAKTTFSEYNKDLTHILEMMEQKKYNIKKIKYGLGVILALTFFTFYEFITSWFGKQASNITMKSLDDPEFQKKVDEFVKERISVLSKDEQVQQNLEYLLSVNINKLTQREDIQQMLTDMFYKIFTSDTIAKAGDKLSAQVVHDLINLPEYDYLRVEIIKYIRETVKIAANDEEIHKYASILISQTFWAMFKTSPKKAEIIIE